MIYIVQLLESGQWVPAIRGSLNQTGKSDLEASIFTSWKDSDEAQLLAIKEFPNSHVRVLIK